MRKLNTSDVFALARLIKKSGLRDELKKQIQKLTIKADSDVESIGINGLFTICETMSEEGNEQIIYEFLARPFECTAEDVAAFDLAQLKSNLEQLVKENNLRDFFKSASDILGKN